MGKKDIDPGMHTAEHILNATMVRFLGCERCFSAHIEKKKSKCDYYFPRQVSEEEIKEVEKRVGEVIARDVPVTEEFISKKEAEGEYALERLPADTPDRIRVIRVGDYDACPCIGPHVNSSAEVGDFRIVSFDQDNEVLRIRFKV